MLAPNHLAKSRIQSGAQLLRPCPSSSSSTVRTPEVRTPRGFSFWRASLAICGVSRASRLGRRCKRRGGKKLPEQDGREVKDATLEQIFDDIDEMSSGFIDQKDLPKAVEAVAEASGRDFSSQDVQKVFCSFGDVRREDWLQAANMQVSPEFRANAIESFNEMDADGSGAIDKAEFARAFGIVKARGDSMMELGEDQITALWERYDLNGDGKIALSEYLKVAESARMSEVARTLNDIFDFVDADGNGKITAADVGTALQRLEQKEEKKKFSSDERELIKRLFCSVSREQWVKGLRRLERRRIISRSQTPRISLIAPKLFRNFKTLSSELLAGLTVAIVVLPSAVAYGNATGLGAASGLYSAIFLGFCGALFGSTPTLISGPAGSLVLPTAAVVLNFKEPHVVGAIIITTGILQLAFGALRLGGALSFVPSIVISAFVTGLGILIVCMQLPALLGFATKANVVASLGVLPYCIAHANVFATAIGLGTLGVLLKWPSSWLPGIPKSLLALILSAAAAAAFSSRGIVIPLLGAIPRGLPKIVAPALSLHMLPAILKAATVLAVVGTIDTLLTSLIVDNMMSTFHDPNRELIGQGLGNTLSGLFGGLPGAGNTVPTLVNIKQNSRSPVSGMFHAVVMVGILLGLGPLAAYLPLPALAAVLINSGIGLIDWSLLRRLSNGKLRGEDLATFTVTAVGTVFFDLFLAVAAGSTMAAWYFVAKMRRLQFTTYSPQVIETGKTTVCKLRGPATFAIADPMLRSLMPQLAGKNSVEFDLSGVTMLGCSAVMALEQLAEKIIERGGTLAVYGLKQSVIGYAYVEHSKIPKLASNASPYDVRQLPQSDKVT